MGKDMVWKLYDWEKIWLGKIKLGKDMVGKGIVGKSYSWEKI